MIILCNFTSQNLMTMSKNNIILSVVAFICCGCGHRIDSADLNRIDSLVSAERYDSAYQEVQKINPQTIVNPEDKAHYNLLLTRTSILTDHTCPSDSLIDSSISFYEKVGDKEHLCDAYYYKAFYLIDKGDYSSAIILCKNAEDLANQTKNKYQQYKIAECIAHINAINGNYDLQLQYSRYALNYALNTRNQEWVLLAYNSMCEAFLFHELIDSAFVYAGKMIPLVENMNLREKPYILDNIGYTFFVKGEQQAKSFFEKSLALHPMARTIEHLAYLYLHEGQKERAYNLWKEALVTEDVIPQDNTLYQILQHDLEHHNIEGACERLYNIVSIKDSLNNVLKDRSIQRIQQDFDEKATQEKHNQEVLHWVVTALALVIIVLLLLGDIQYRRHKARLLLDEHQMLIAHYQSEINRLKSNREGTEQQIADLNQQINDLLEQDSPRLYHGKMLYDQIVENGTTVTWTKEDYNCFVDYYKAKDFASYSKIVRKHHPKTVHNTLFLILYEIGKDDKDVRRIMGITQEAIRSTRFRINKNAKK